MLCPSFPETERVFVMEIVIRSVKSIEGCQHFQMLQQLVWSSVDDDIVPTHVLVTVVKNGGGLLGAYAEGGPAETGGMVGAAFWWPGIDEAAGDPDSMEPQIKACSHIVGVLPGWQGKRIGLRLKLAQREVVLAQGATDWITWTYDPLYRANGVFNIHRLGATCNTYMRDIYGAMQDALNRGVPSDRCQVDWRLNSPHVLSDISPQRVRPAWHIDDFHILPTDPRMDGLAAPVDVALVLDGAPLAAPIPDDIAAIRAADGALSLDWRLYMRGIFEQAFPAGYTMVDCIRIGDKGWHYVLVREYV